MNTNTVLLIIEDKEKLEPLNSFLKQNDYPVKVIPENDISISLEVSSASYAIIIFSITRTTQCHIELLEYIQQCGSKPVIIFTDESDDEWIMKAVNVGANSIVVDGIKENRIKPIIDIAVARFQRCMTLRSELSETKQKLAERKDIDRAKGILMKMKQLDEDQAYQLLRKMAMEKNQRMGEVASTIILAAELLD